MFFSCSVNVYLVNHVTMALQTAKCVGSMATQSNILGYVIRHNTSSSKAVTLNSVKISRKLKVTSKETSKESKVKTKPLSHSREIMEYFAANNSIHLMDNLPLKILKRKRVAPDAFYIVNKDVAKQVVTSVKSSLLKGNCPILEANPGLGLVSEELISAGVPHLRLYEPTSSFNAQLKSLKLKYPNQIEVKNFDLFLLYKQAFQDRMDAGARVENMLHGITKRLWKEDPAMKIIGALPSVNFLKHLIISFVFQNGIMMYGRPELYLVMPPPLFVHLTCNSTAGYLHYRSTTVLFQLIFRWELLGKFPRKAYLPWEAEYSVTKKSKLAKVKCIDPEYLYLVKIEPREDFFESVTTSDKLQPLWYFIRQNLLSRKNQVIPQLEKWIPGCGPRLIVGGMNIFTQFGDLTPQEILAVFNEFSNWPEYPQCPFLPSMETNFIKMDTVPDEIEKDLDESVAEEHETVEDLEEH